jgi:hypothetical protein
VSCVSVYMMEMPNSYKGSRLKPDAPEFVPTQMNSTPIGHPKLNLKEAAKAQKKKERDERKAASLAKKAGKKVAKHLENPDGTSFLPSQFFPADQQSLASPADESTPLIQTDGHMTDAEASTADKPKLKRSRFARRHMAKSEPGNRVIVSHDGQQDSDLTAVSSGEGQPLLVASSSVRYIFSPCLLSMLTAISSTVVSRLQVILRPQLKSLVPIVIAVIDTGE